MDDNPFEEETESTITRGIKKFLEVRYPGAWYKIHGGPYQEAGIPDIVGCHEGHFFAFEVKRPRKKRHVSDQQKYQMSRIAMAHGTTAVVTSKEDVQEVMLLWLTNK